MAAAPGRRVKRLHKELSLEEKIKLIESCEQRPKPTQQQLGDQFGIGRSTVSDILRKKDSYKAQWEENQSSKRQRLNKSTRLDSLNKLVFDFFCKARSKNIPISGPIIQKKALEFSAELEIENFQASNGWLTNWKGRYNIKQFVVSGESADVSPEVVAEFKERLSSIIADYDSHDIFNCDETGVFYRSLPDKTLACKGDSVKGGKHSKERLTILFACSLSGEKLKPLVIGHSENPRAFCGLNKEQLPVTWRSNKKAWMTTLLFNEWLGHVNKRMKLHKRRILLFMDNVSSHGGASELALSNITVRFLPPNTTSSLQPLDAGIIQAFKLHFRKQLLTHVIARIDSCSTASEVSKGVTVLNAITWIDKAWTAVQPLTIAKCFRACGFPWLHESDESDEDTEIEEISSGVEVVQDLLSRAASSGMELAMDAEEYTRFERSMPTENIDDWERELVEQYKERCQTSSATKDPDIEEANDDDDKELCPLNYSDALDLLGLLHWFASQKDGDLLPGINKLTDHVEQKILEKQRQNKQTCITDFFVNTQNTSN